jgi:hypothetical protein
MYVPARLSFRCLEYNDILDTNCLIFMNIGTNNTP